MQEKQSHRLNPWVGRSLGEGNGSALQYFCLRHHMGRGVWWDTVHGAERVRHDWETELLPRLGAKYSSESACLYIPTAHTPHPDTHTASPTMTPYPTLVHLLQFVNLHFTSKSPKPMVYTGIHSLCCTLYRHKDTYPPLQYLLSVFKAQVNISWMPIVWHPGTTFHIVL